MQRSAVNYEMKSLFFPGPYKVSHLLFGPSRFDGTVDYHGPDQGDCIFHAIGDTGIEIVERGQAYTVIAEAGVKGSSPGEFPVEEIIEYPVSNHCKFFHARCNQ